MSARSGDSAASFAVPPTPAPSSAAHPRGGRSNVMPMPASAGPTPAGAASRYVAHRGSLPDLSSPQRALAAQPVRFYSNSRERRGVIYTAVTLRAGYGWPSNDEGGPRTPTIRPGVCILFPYGCVGDGAGWRRGRGGDASCHTGRSPRITAGGQGAPPHLPPLC